MHRSLFCIEVVSGESLLTNSSEQKLCTMHIPLIYVKLFLEYTQHKILTGVIFSSTKLHGELLVSVCHQAIAGILRVGIIRAMGLAKTMRKTMGGKINMSRGYVLAAWLMFLRG